MKEMQYRTAKTGYLDTTEGWFVFTVIKWDKQR